MNTSNKSVVYTSDRGNDVYSRENEMIRIKIDASTCAMLNTKASFLRYSLKIIHDGARVKPSENFLHPFKNVYIYDGNESTLLEQMNDTDISSAIKNYYGTSTNDKNMQSVFEAKSSNNFPYVSADDQTRPSNNNRGGGFQNAFVKFQDDMSDEGSRKAELIYNFPLSGILGPKINYVFPVLAVGGLVIRIELMDPNRFYSLQFLKNTNGVATIGYGSLESLLTDQSFSLEADNSYTQDLNQYQLAGYIDDQGAAQAGAWDGNTNATGFLLAHTAGGNDAGRVVDNIRNVSFLVGSQIIYGNSGEQDLAQKAAGFIAANKITRISTVGGYIGLHFDQVANGTAFAEGDPVKPYLSNCQPKFEVSDVQYIANVVDTDPQLLQEQVQLFQSGRLPLPIRSYTNVRVNIPNGALQNEINIPCNLRFVYSVLAYPEANDAQKFQIEESQSDHAGLKNYNWVLNGLNIPNLPVDLEKVAAGRVSALALKEVEKALKETSIPIKNLRNPNEMFVIGRRLGVYSRDGKSDGTYNAIESPLKLRVNYTTRPTSIVYNFVFFHYKQVRQQGNRRVVIE